MESLRLKPLTAFVIEDFNNDCATITIKNEDNAVIRELKHSALSTKLNKTEAINDHLRQMIKIGFNITKLETNMVGISLP
jgi:hypothetical protein